MSKALQPFRVTLEQPEETGTWPFECMAEATEHAEEQAQNAYPQATVLHCVCTQGRAAWARTLKSGQVVWWSDPDSGHASGYFNLDELDSADGEEGDEVWAVMSPIQAEVAFDTRAPITEVWPPDERHFVAMEMTLNVTFELNGVSPTDMLNGLEKRVFDHIGNGMLSGNTPAEAHHWAFQTTIEPGSFPEALKGDNTDQGRYLAQQERAAAQQVFAVLVEQGIEDADDAQLLTEFVDWDRFRKARGDT